MEIFHLLFANDTLNFIFHASHDQLAYLSWLLMWVECKFGTRASVLYLWEILRVLMSLAKEFACKLGTFPWQEAHFSS